MRLPILVLSSLFVVLFFNDVTADGEEKPHHKKKIRKHRKHKTTTTILPSSDSNLEIHEESYFESKQSPEEVISRKNLFDRIAEGNSKIQTESKNIVDDSLNIINGGDITKENIFSTKESIVELKQDGIETDPCETHHCGAGKVCIADENNIAKCVCIPQCPQEEEVRLKVCTNFNETWGSDCEVYRKRCLCEDRSPECDRAEFAHVHIEYYGECRDIPECAVSEMADFPRRMRDWLFNIMRDLADREELSPHFLKLEREAETNMTLRWMNAAVWKFCDLDGHPADRSVSRHELFPIRAPLMALEHCIAPFLNKCDANDDHLISIKEWAKCLELNEEEIDDHCGEIHEENEKV